MVVLIYLGTGVAAFPNVSTLEAAIAPFKEALLGFQNHQPKQLEESLQFHYNVYTFQYVLPHLLVLIDLRFWDFFPSVPGPGSQDIENYTC